MFGIGDAISAGLKVIDKFIPDPKAKIEAEKALRDSLMAWDKMQADINVEEAKHSSIFVSGWRPFFGWIGGIAFAWQYLCIPMITFVCVAIGKPLPPLPAFDFGAMEYLVYGILGIAGARTFEKVKGVARK